MTMRRMLAAFLTALLLSAPAARAQDSSGTPYPEKIVRIVVPFTAGGAVDLVARIMAKNLADIFHREVFVENRPGASGNVGAETVAQASADGYTLLVSASTLVVNPIVAAEPPPFDPLKDFHPAWLDRQGPAVVHHPCRRR